MEYYYCKKLFALCLKAKKHNEVPIAALIVKNGKIISKAYNRKNIDNICLYHAEVLAIIKASKKLKSWNLSDCIMYVNLEPCEMCKQIIKQARLNKIHYMCKQNVNISHNSKQLYVLIESTFDFENLLKNFFKTLR